jgi:hypothetical protein
MAKCGWCELDMAEATSCTVEVLHRDGEPVPMSPWGRGGAPRARRCGDCGVRPGGFHHPGCDLQSCPVCGGQMMTCGCRFDEDGEPGLDSLAT